MITSVPTYPVTVSREDNLWVAVVDGLPGGATDVERMVDLETEVRDLIAGLLDVDYEDFEIEWHYRQDDLDLTAALCTLRSREADADAALHKRDEARQAAIAARDCRNFSSSAIATAPRPRAGG